MSQQQKLKHIRILAKADIILEDTRVNLVFTRAFLADQYKGLRTLGSRHPNSTAVNIDVNERLFENFSSPQPEKLAKNVKLKPKEKTGNSIFKSRKYFVSVSHTLSMLQRDSCSSSSSSEDASTDVNEPQSEPVFENSYQLNNETKPTLNTVKCFDELPETLDLEATLRRLGLPTQFGGKLSITEPPQCENSHEDEDLSTWADEQLLITATRRQPLLSSLSRDGLSKSCDNLNVYDHRPVLRRCNSNDVARYSRALLSNLCCLLELSCSYDHKRSVTAPIIQIDLPEAWHSNRFNLNAFLYSCRQYWRHKVPSLKRRSQTHTSPLELGDLESDPLLAKYWDQRFRLFSRFNEGVQIDRDGLFSATPEAIAAHQARRIYRALVSDPSSVENITVVDACSGLGVNSIQLALLGFRVIAVEIDPVRIAMSVNNANLYGVGSRIEHVCADFFLWAHQKLKERTKHSASSLLKYSTVVLSPPWGGPAYLNEAVFDLNCVQFGADPSYNLWSAVRLASQLSYGNVLLFLPRTTNVAQLPALAESLRSAYLRTCYTSTLPSDKDSINIEIEADLLNAKTKALTIYTGYLCVDHGTERIPQMLSRPPADFDHENVVATHQFYGDSDSTSFYSSSDEYSTASEHS